MSHHNVTLLFSLKFKRGRQEVERTNFHYYGYFKYIFFFTKLTKKSHRPSSPGDLHVAVDLEESVLVSGDLNVEHAGLGGRLFPLKVGARHGLGFVLVERRIVVCKVEVGVG